MLGDFARLDPETLARLRDTPIEAYRQLTTLPDASRLNLDSAYARLTDLMNAAHFPINPIAAGSPYPDERTAWGAEGDSRCLAVDEVTQAARHLSRTPFNVLKPHLRQVLEAEKGVLVDLDPGSPRYLEPLWPAEVRAWSRSCSNQDVVASRCGEGTTSRIEHDQGAGCRSTSASRPRRA
ncbi:hypothetical protein [Micromonospora trifolii]|uniref:hypothetical protein n=1 Tax=Micromonospora trifolii TaxID=2911208 RepID=UPI003CF18883